MKKIIFIGLLSATIACNSDSKDSVEKADSANKEKIDSTHETTKAAIATDEASSKFLVSALDGGIMEVELGNIAQAKARNERVKNFGKMMITDHEASNAKIRDLAAVRSVTLPQRVSDEHASMIGDLNKKDNNDFDKAYINMMVDDHKEDIKEFESAESKSGDTEVRAFINSTLPMLRRHLDSCSAIQQMLKTNL